jgi:hypothetical protein
VRARITIAITGVSLLSLTGCGGSSATEDSGRAPAATAEVGTSNDQTSGGDTSKLPDMVGKGLQSAQDQAQGAGFQRLTSHDSLGRGRNQILDREWKVCFQTPRPGEHPTDTQIDFGTVRLKEDCPAKDGSNPEPAGTKMPNFKGKSLKVARQALDSNTSITVNDASGQDRIVIVESNWKVCSQDPKPGSKFNGQPVTFDVVKFDEAC